jgi:hypothetical protein
MPTLARRCRHVSQARDVYFLLGRLRLAVSSTGARDIGEWQMLNDMRNPQDHLSRLKRDWAVTLQSRGKLIHRCLRLQGYIIDAC